MSENMTPERQVIFDAIVARVLAIGMEKDEARAVGRATRMINSWTWCSDNSMDDRGHLTIYDWVDPELCRLLDEDERLRFGVADRREQEATP